MSPSGYVCINVRIWYYLGYEWQVTSIVACSQVDQHVADSDTTIVQFTVSKLRMNLVQNVSQLDVTLEGADWMMTRCVADSAYLTSSPCHVIETLVMSQGKRCRSLPLPRSMPNRFNRELCGFWQWCFGTRLRHCLGHRDVWSRTVSNTYSTEHIKHLASRD